MRKLLIFFLPTILQAETENCYPVTIDKSFNFQLCSKQFLSYKTDNCAAVKEGSNDWVWICSDGETGTVAEDKSLIIQLEVKERTGVAKVPRPILDTTKPCTDYPEKLRNCEKFYCETQNSDFKDVVTRYWIMGEIEGQCHVVNDSFYAINNCLYDKDMQKTMANKMAEFLKTKTATIDEDDPALSRLKRLCEKELK